ncbi:MAG: 30S ribosomal protein S20 [Acidobacteria bacterium]|nr:30S ribosomal protein S20 [Acidobacteriota bacterium]MBI3263404.1 30S ribosomal protein S20 [Acidobacteriota bacterium]
MASHASAVKAHRQSLKRQQINREQRSRLRSQLKGIRSAVGSKGENVASDLKAAISLIDKMAGKGIIHRNAAARYKSRLASKAR